MSLHHHGNGDPYVVDKNLGEKLVVGENDLPLRNADGLEVVELTQEQKYLFDTRGWLLVPAVLDTADIEAMRDFALRIQDDPESLPEHERCHVAGPLQKLADHPVVVGFLNEFLAHPHLSSADSYGFRLESSAVRYRTSDPEQQGEFKPHNGSGMFRFANDSHHYQCIPGRAFSGLTRVVWELTPVVEGRGALVADDVAPAVGLGRAGGDQQAEERDRGDREYESARLEKEPHGITLPVEPPRVPRIALSIPSRRRRWV